MIKLSSDTYIISDLHFFHNNIIKYCNRPYNAEDEKDIYRMNEDILSLFDKLPPKCDIYNLGDVFFPNGFLKKTIKENPNILKSFVDRMSNNGLRRLYLILGNHDILKNQKGRISFYQELGFNKVYDTPIIIENNWILCHEPVYSNGNFNVIYGHTHDKNIEEDYFVYDYENYCEELRKAKLLGLESPAKEVKYPNRIINTGKYINACYDKNYKFLNLNSIVCNY